MVFITAQKDKFFYFRLNLFGDRLLLSCRADSRMLYIVGPYRKRNCAVWCLHSWQLDTSGQYRAQPWTTSDIFHRDRTHNSCIDLQSPWIHTFRRMTHIPG